MACWLGWLAGNIWWAWADPPPPNVSFLPAPPGPNCCLVWAWCIQSQVENMTNKWHVYMTGDGRISLAGLSGDKCDYLADAIIDSVKNH